jgi:hypothetical protein
MIDIKNDCYHYVYYSYEEWGRGYIGKRSCVCAPEEDKKYFGSFSDKTFNPTEKIIIATFRTEEEALACEVRLHNYYAVDINPHFANRAKQTSTKFYFNSTGIVRSEKTRQKISGKNNPMFGKTHSEEARRKISKAAKNISDETRQKMSKARDEKNSPMFGKTHSKETRQKLSEAGKKLVGENNPFFGKTHSDETRQRLSEVQTGKVLSKETRQKLSEAGKGRTHSEETKRKMSEAQKNRYRLKLVK